MDLFHLLGVENPFFHGGILGYHQCLGKGNGFLDIGIYGMVYFKESAPFLQEKRGGLKWIREYLH